MDIFNLGTFFFLSLGITFILCCLLVYHFKRRLDLFEQKNDTIFEIVNNVLSEISNIKQKQNVLFMLVKNTNIPSSLATDQNNNEVISKEVLIRKKNVFDEKVEEEEDDYDDEEEEDGDDDEEDGDDDDDEEEGDKKDEDGKKGGDFKESKITTDRDDDENTLQKKVIKMNPDYIYGLQNEVEKIKVIDDEDSDIIDLTDDNINKEMVINHEDMYVNHEVRDEEEDDFQRNQLFSFVDFFSNNVMNNQSNDSLLNIDLNMLNLRSLIKDKSKLEMLELLPQLRSHLMEFNDQYEDNEEDDSPPLKIQILENDQDDDIVNIYDDLPDLIPVYQESQQLDIEYDDIIEYEPDTIIEMKTTPEPDPEQETETSLEQEPIIEMEPTPEPEPQPEPEPVIEMETTPEPEPEQETVIETVESIIDGIIDDSISVISEKSINIAFNKEKRDEKENYKKMNIQALRTMVVSKGIVEDASKLKKNEILNMLL